MLYFTSDSLDQTEYLMTLDTIWKDHCNQMVNPNLIKYNIAY